MKVLADPERFKHQAVGIDSRYYDGYDDFKLEGLDSNKTELITIATGSYEELINFAKPRFRDVIDLLSEFQ